MNIFLSPVLAASLVWPLPWSVDPDVGALTWLHVQVSPNVMALGHRAAEVDDATLVRALVRRLDAGQAQPVWNVAAGHFHHLRGTSADGFIC